MHYEEFAPPDDLASLVRCAWLLTGDAGAGDALAHAEPALPDGSPELLFILGDPFEHVAANGVVTVQPPAFLVGQITGPMTVRPTGRIDLVAVRFEAHGASILHPMLRDLTDRWIEVTALSEATHDAARHDAARHDAARHAPSLHALGDSLAAATSPAMRVQLAMAAVRAIAARSPRPDPRVAAAVRAIRQSHGTLALDALADSLRVAPRTLQRLFAAQVGITPKHLARIVRFQRVFAAWRHDPGSFARVAAECGYFDQSHLVRDFQELAGMPPATLMSALPAFTGLFLP